MTHENLYNQDCGSGDMTQKLGILATLVDPGSVLNTHITTICMYTC